ncbi:MAG: DUF6456 domain-containing protein [Alphaproteobacteria bacterium]|nr:DUF6456 domain-containing protein [Alphaproteobacteria bacterium]
MSRARKSPGKAPPARILRRDIVYQQRDAVIVDEADPDGRPVEHIRVYNTVLDRLWRDGEGSITREQFDAGVRFHRHYTLAGLGPRYGRIDPDRVRGGVSDITEQQAWAWNKVTEALAGLTETGQSAAEFVIGMGHAIGEWARRMRQNGKSMSDEKARGVVHIVLEQLARHYGFLR